MGFVSCEQARRHIQIAMHRVDRLTTLIGNGWRERKKGAVHQARGVEQQSVGHGSALLRFRCEQLRNWAILPIIP